MTQMLHPNSLHSSPNSVYETASRNRPSSRTKPTTVSCRLVDKSDERLLISMREACGWGADQVPTHVTRTLAGVEALHLFLVDGEPAGMGSYEVEDGSGPGYLILADRERGIVRIHSLFVLRAYQGTGLGNEILDFLEGECFKKGAKVITIDTLSTQNRTVDWYRRRGYRDFEGPQDILPKRNAYLKLTTTEIRR